MAGALLAIGEALKNESEPKAAVLRPTEPGAYLVGNPDATYIGESGSRHHLLPTDTDLRALIRECREAASACREAKDEADRL